VLAWSLATIAGMPLQEFARQRRMDVPHQARQEIDRKVRGAAYTIIGGKGATYYGIGSALARITNAILHDQRSVLTVCAPTDEVVGVRDVTISLPRLVGGSGILETFPVPLDEAERAQLRKSAEVVRQAIQELP
jgi:L-lactate dehydrogenase